MSDGSVFAFGLVVFAIALGFYIQSLAIPFIVIGGGLMFMATINGLLNYRKVINPC